MVTDTDTLTNKDADIQAAFTTFGRKTTSVVLTCADDPGAEAVAERLDPSRVRRYGESPRADYRILDVTSRKLTVERNDRFEDYATSTYEV